MYTRLGVSVRPSLSVRAQSLTSFAIRRAGGCSSAHLHCARTVPKDGSSFSCFIDANGMESSSNTRRAQICRRAERLLIPLLREEAIDASAYRYLNRFSLQSSSTRANDSEIHSQTPSASVFVSSRRRF